MKQRHKVISAAMVILERDGKVFLIKRANTGWRDGQYDLIAGHVEPGERVADAAIREAKEEAGVNIDKSDLQLVHVLSLSREDGDAQYFYFKVTDWKGEPEAKEKDKSDGSGWYSTEDLEKIDVLPVVAHALGEVRAGKIYSEGNFT
jgi:8-oxo-dGTP pyrophosphatase MutT (NUDIX family)